MFQNVKRLGFIVAVWAEEGPCRKDIPDSVDVIGCDTIESPRKTASGAPIAMASIVAAISLFVFTTNPRLEFHRRCCTKVEVGARIARAGIFLQSDFALMHMIMLYIMFFVYIGCYIYII